MTAHSGDAGKRVEELRTMFRDATTETAISAFEQLDPFVVATAPDTPQGIMDAWLALHRLLPAEYIDERKRRQEAGASHV